MTTTLLQLDETTAVRLLVYEGDKSRLCCLLKDVWRQVPAPERHAIAQFWRKPNEAIGLPVIELSNLWDSRGLYAKLTGDGRTMKISEKDFRDMPDAAARHTIAHELAHVLQKANGIRDASCRTGEHPPSESEGIQYRSKKWLDRHADAKSAQWGFYTLEVVEWRACNAVRNAGSNCQD